MKPVLTLAALSLLAGTLLAQERSAAPGPAVGERIPAFELVDQLGRSRNLQNLSGDRGLLLLFSRSADW